MSNDIRVNRTEINRLTKAIAAEEQNINLAFQRIGQSYFAAHRNDPEENQKANIQAVLEAMQRATGYKDQINVLRGIAICPSCKAEVDSSAAFCSRCGAKMPVQARPVQPAVPGAPICPNCGNTCSPGTKFCNLCGTRLPEAAPAPAYAAPAPTYAPAPEPAADAEPTPASEPAAPEAAAEAEPAQKFCANCGTPLEPGYRFCLECGTPVQ